MGISVADNFSYLGGKPLDGRIQYATLAAMKAMADATLYEGCEAYCVETDKYYQWKSSNTVDASTGKWRERETGGGGTVVSLSDVTNASAIVTDKSTGEVHISWNDPNDIPGETGGYLAQWKQTLVVKKVGSAPTSPSDGTTICTNFVKNQYSAGTGYVTDTVSTNPDVYTYYRFFPMSTRDITTYGTTKTVNVNALVYGFKITQSESNPSARVTYLEDAVGMTPAYMDFTNGVFEYGSWDDAFFINGLKPVMLNSDGTEAYALNPEDLTKKADGTASDVANTSFDGNAMMRIPKVYIKMEEDNNGDISVYVSEDKLDNNYHCWAHHDDQGNEIPYLYLPIYSASINSGVMRSMSGLSVNANVSLVNQMSAAEANNGSSGKHLWSIMTFSAWNLIRVLAVLISKSTNSKEKFGYGIYNSYHDAATCGVYNDKGLFYGTGTSASVKIFGLENYYGMRDKRILGLGCDVNGYIYKLTYGQEDGSTQDGYAADGTGFLSTNVSCTSGSLKTATCVNGALLYTESGASATTYYTDGVDANSVGKFACVGGYSNWGTKTGIFGMMLYPNTATDWDIGTNIECRPRLGEESIVS